MFDNEEKITLTEAARLAPGRPHASSLWRWARKGCKSRGGGRVYLEHVRFGGKVFTSAQALSRFAQRLADADAPHFAEADAQHAITTTPTSTSRNDAQRERDIARAEAELAAAGI